MFICTVYVYAAGAAQLLLGTVKQIAAAQAVAPSCCMYGYAIMLDTPTRELNKIVGATM